MNKRSVLAYGIIVGVLLNCITCAEQTMAQSIQAEHSNTKKVLLVTAGSRGDVQPFVALGKGLQEAGYDVTICTHSFFQPFIEQHGISYAFMNDELRALVDTDAGRKALASSSSIVSWIKTARALSKQANEIQTRMLDEVWDAAQEADMIIYHPKVMGAFDIAQTLKIPCCQVLTAPLFVPTKAFAHCMFPQLPLGGLYNKLTYKLTSLAQVSFLTGLNVWRKKMGPKPRSFFTNDLVQFDGKPIHQLHCFSAHVVPKPSDWPETAHVAGYWFLDHQHDWQPSADLVEFLQAGPQPIYLGFGSMVPTDPKKFTETILKAIKQSGQRAILAKGWGALDDIETDDNIYVIKSAPHEWLFNQVAAVVHHGGAGTTAAALRAGKPQIIVPFFGDQSFWAQRMANLDVSATPLPQKKVTADLLAEKIIEVVTDSQMGESARLLQEKIEQEDGIEAAIKIIDQILSQ